MKIYFKILFSAFLILPLFNIKAQTFEMVKGVRSGNNLSACDNPNKTAVCHIPFDDPSNAHTICVGAKALAAHLAHGDYVGRCDDPNGQLEYEFCVSPNPYFGYTTIHYILPTDGHVVMDVSDQFSKKIQTIVNQLQVAGDYTYQFSARSLGYPPGFYLLNFTYFTTPIIHESVILLEY